jgi:DNA-binding transcriptional LysR family regulator
MSIDDRKDRTQPHNVQQQRAMGGGVAGRHLQSFIAVAQERHFGRAAERLHVAQATLSRRIRLIEEELGAELFDRSVQPVRLTAAGTAFLAEAQLASHHVQRALEHGRRAARGEVGELSVGAISWATNAIVPAALRAFRARTVDVRVALYTTSPGNQVEALQRRQLDVGFSAFAPWLRGRSGLQIEPLLHEPLVAIVPDDHAFARRAAVSLEELARERFIVLSDAVAPGLIDKQVSLFHERGLSVADVQTVNDPWALLALIAGGMGIGLHMASFSNAAHRGLAFVPLEGEAPTATLFMLSRADDQRTAVALFLETTRAAARSLVPPLVFAGLRQPG